MPLETARPLNDLVTGVRAAFADRFGEEPQCVAAAPGRVNLIGEHTDYNEGFVLPMAIDRYTVVAASARPEGSGPTRVLSATMQEEIEFARSAGVGEPSAGWAGYVRGVIDAYEEAGVSAPPFDAVIDSTVPVGAGLSSSAALEVSLALAIEELAGAPQDGRARALLCQRAEHIGAGVPCGFMDQFASALSVDGHAMLLDCRSQQPKTAPLTDPAVTVLIANSNVQHELAGGEYAERRRQCDEAARGIGVESLRDADLARLLAAEDQLDPLAFTRARHVITENRRTVQAAEAMAARDWPTFGRLMYDSHASMRDDFEITTPEINKLVEIAEAIGPAGGVFGSRMTGGGFGGCTVTLVEAGRVAAVAGALAREYEAATGIRPALLTSRPVSGGRVMDAVRG